MVSLAGVLALALALVPGPDVFGTGLFGVTGVASFLLSVLAQLSESAFCRSLRGHDHAER